MIRACEDKPKVKFAQEVKSPKLDDCGPVAVWPGQRLGWKRRVA